ncbi:MAG: polyprenyl synthetase family protein [Phycisphaerales bacterium]
MVRPTIVQPGATAPDMGLAGPVAQVVASALRDVEAIFERQLASDMPPVNVLCRHVERYRGKMLRPSLVLLSGMAAVGRDDAGAVTQRHLMVGAVVEMIHMATLVHDDVLDEAEVRRQGRTVNSLQGNETAVMLGDYLISNAFHLCSQAGEPWINLLLGKTTNTLCEGELIQLHNRDNLELDEETYFEIVRRKTASLVAACCLLGARLSGASEELAESLGAFGTDVGTAFQIQDDLLDLSGREDVVGKSLGRDLDKGKLTLPLIIHLSRAGRAERTDAEAAIAARDAGALLAMLRRSGALEDARRKALALVERARARLDGLPAGAARDYLAAACGFVVSRDA